MLDWRLWMIVGIVVGLVSVLLSPLQKLTEEFDFKASQKIEKELALEAPKKIKLESGLGRIAVKTWDEPKLKLEVTTRARDESALQRVEILVEQTETVILVRAQAPEGLKFAVDYMLFIPYTAELEVKAAIGEVSLEGVESVLVALGIGRLKAPQLKRARIEVGIGNIELAGAPEDVRIDVGIGAVELGLPLDASLFVQARTGVGSIDLARFAEIIKLSRHEKAFMSEELEGILGTGEGRLSVEVGVGSIVMKEAQ